MKIKISLILFLISIFGTNAQTKEELLGFANVKDTAQWVRIDNSFQTYMRKEVYKAFTEMKRAAAKDGVTLTLRTCYRSFDRQKQIWETKWQALAKNPKFTTNASKARHILRTSSMPGTSRHHWGTDIDLNSLSPAYFEKNAVGIKVYKWLLANAEKFGFYQPYDDKRNGGYQEEKWHWSYFPLAEKFMKKYKETVTHNDIKNFIGSDAAKELDVITNWVENVAKRN